MGRPRREERVDPETVVAMRWAIRQLKHELRSARAQLAIARSGAAQAVEARLAGKAMR